MGCVLYAVVLFTNQIFFLFCILIIGYFYQFLRISNSVFNKFTLLSFPKLSYCFYPSCPIYTLPFFIYFLFFILPLHWTGPLHIHYSSQFNFFYSIPECTNMWASEFWAFTWDLFLMCAYFVLFNALVLVLGYCIFC